MIPGSAGQELCTPCQSLGLGSQLPSSPRQRLSPPQRLRCMQGLGKLRGSSEDNAELEGASDGEVGIDLDDCEDHEEDLEMTAAAGVPRGLAPQHHSEHVSQSLSAPCAASILPCISAPLCTDQQAPIESCAASMLRHVRQTAGGTRPHRMLQPQSSTPELNQCS